MKTFRNILVLLVMVFMALFVKSQNLELPGAVIAERLMVFLGFLLVLAISVFNIYRVYIKK